VNIGTAVATSIQELAEMILSLAPNKLDIEYHAPRDGDVKESCSDITLLKKLAPHSVPKKISPEFLKTI
jgi:nucleoside-diphosphate-sugar epimerase